MFIVWGILFSLSVFASESEYIIGADITVREFRGSNDYLSKVTELPLDSVIRFDAERFVGPQKYQNDRGEIKLSRGEWLKGIVVQSLPDGRDTSQWEGRELYMSRVHIVDSREVGAADPGFGDTEMGRICEQISRSSNLSEGRIGEATRHGITRYFTPIFPNLTDQHNGKPYRYWCLNYEGSCIVGDTLWNYPSRSYTRSDILCKYGFGNGQNSYNKTNCLNPCTTVAADQSKNRAGTVIYVPGMRGKICPHTGEPIHGCFIVGDVGSAIRGKGRFDLFTGTCDVYNGGVCEDEYQWEYRVSKGARFFKLNRNHPLAKKLRQSNDRYVRGNNF